MREVITAMIAMVKNLVIAIFSTHTTSGQTALYLPQSVHVTVMASYSGVRFRKRGNCIALDILNLYQQRDGIQTHRR